VNDILFAAFRDELQKIAFVSSGFRRLAGLTLQKPGFPRSVAQGTLKSIGSSPQGAKRLLHSRVREGGTRLTNMDRETNRALLDAARPGIKKRKPLTERDLTAVKIDGARVPASAFDGMTDLEAQRFAASLGHTGPLGLPKLRGVNLTRVQQTLDDAALGQGPLGKTLLDLQTPDFGRLGGGVGAEEAFAAVVKALPAVRQTLAKSTKTLAKSTTTVGGRPPTSIPAQPPY
jgi:hypothetical protein